MIRTVAHHAPADPASHSIGTVIKTAREAVAHLHDADPARRIRPAHAGCGETTV